MRRDNLVRLWSEEQLRQVSETFNQQKRQNERWFWLRLAMGWGIAVLLLLVGVIASYIVINEANYSPVMVKAAGVVLFGDLVALWKLVFSPASMPRLTPVTRIDHDDPDTDKAV